MPPKKASPCKVSLGEEKILLVKITTIADDTYVRCAHDSHASICAQCKAEQEAVDMFLI